jgi:hypothetical protein
LIQPLTLPKPNLRLFRKKDEIFVWCIARKKNLLVTPEEWVRQHVIHDLVNGFGVPLGLIIAEHTIKVHSLTRRCDITVIGTDQLPKLIVECKAPNIPLDQAVLNQIAQYNFTLNVDFLMLTNGIQHIYCKIDRENRSLVFLENLPSFSNMDN